MHERTHCRDRDANRHCHAATDADGYINADCDVPAAGVRAGPVWCFHADCEDAMIDQLCDEQLLIAQMVRQARRRGDFAMVGRYMACRRRLDGMIKEQS